MQNELDVDNQFAEWDRFDLIYEHSESADEAFERYKRLRKVEQAAQRWMEKRRATRQSQRG